MANAFATLNIDDREVYVEIEGTVEWEGRGRHSRIVNVEIETVKCACGAELSELSNENREVCEEALRESEEIEKAEFFIDQMEN